MRPDQFPLVDGPVKWDGKAEYRLYAFDKKECGWKVSLTVECNGPDIAAKVNETIDEELTKLSAEIAPQGPATTQADDQLRSRLVEAMPKNWKLREMTNGKIAPTHWPEGQGWQIFLERTGTPSEDYIRGVGGEVIGFPFGRGVGKGGRARVPLEEE